MKKKHLWNNTHALNCFVSFTFLAPAIQTSERLI